MSDLTKQEQANVRMAMQFLRAKLGTWKSVAGALRMNWPTLMASKGKGTVSASVAFRVARAVGVGVDDVLSGKYVPPGVCPRCGEKLPE